MRKAVSRAQVNRCATQNQQPTSATRQGTD